MCTIEIDAAAAEALARAVERGVGVAELIADFAAAGARTNRPLTRA